MISNVNLTSTAIVNTINAFRLGREAEANEGFIEIIDRMGQLLPTIPQNALAKLAVLMQQTLEAQKRQDHIGVADLLEYELLYTLRTSGLLID